MQQKFARIDSRIRVEILALWNMPSIDILEYNIVPAWWRQELRQSLLPGSRYWVAKSQPAAKDVNKVLTAFVIGLAYSVVCILAPLTPIRPHIKHTIRTISIIFTTDNFIARLLII